MQKKLLSVIGSSAPQMLSEHHLNSLVENDFAVIDDFFSSQEVSLLKEEMDGRFTAGNFKDAGIGKGHHQNTAIRSDKIMWIEPQNLPAHCRFFFTKLDQLIVEFNQAFFLSLRQAECHFARYEPGTHYKRHLDTFHSDNNRKISLVFYLNDNWQEEEGGALRLYRQNPVTGEDFIDILPVAGRLACFRSDLVEHEVLPATRNRLSITGWLKPENVLF